MSQDIFQDRMDEILEDLPGVVGITDDVCVPMAKMKRSTTGT